jgi:hypothetical protein
VTRGGVDASRVPVATPIIDHPLSPVRYRGDHALQDPRWDHWTREGYRWTLNDP